MELTILVDWIRCPLGLCRLRVHAEKNNWAIEEGGELDVRQGTSNRSNLFYR